jgi:hypothetical protein
VSVSAASVASASTCSIATRPRRPPGRRSPTPQPRSSPRSGSAPHRGSSGRPSEAHSACASRHAHQGRADDSPTSFQHAPRSPRPPGKSRGLQRAALPAPARRSRRKSAASRPDRSHSPARCTGLDTTGKEIQKGNESPKGRSIKQKNEAAAHLQPASSPLESLAFALDRLLQADDRGALLLEGPVLVRIRDAEGDQLPVEL